MSYFETLKQAQDHVNKEYPHLKVFQQPLTVDFDDGVVAYNFGYVSFWVEPSMIDGRVGWTYNY